MRLSIRWRLSLWNTAALAVVLTAFAAMIYYVLAREHYERIDRALRKELQELEDDPGRLADPSALGEWIADAREDENIFCVVQDASGQIVARTKDLPQADVLSAGAA